ncbi:hypothetical protein [Tautonia plasticadhaerens]|uniref:J domain-containing protein n=1 Tax=Tautonia plasticadhaerens TaxID=2527974 RepID=A0A518H201_9BACT|nr:hypothetical protein [Tautonia plasticadhaerens]QDV34871.1 hypothetical protein ElP_27680 [Tautonia plasticadhaerens]
MAFIALRRSRNTLNYYLVESYRDENGRSRKRTLCYLGREQDDTGTLDAALAHWERQQEQAAKAMRRATCERKQVLRRKLEAAQARIGIIQSHLDKAAAAEAERRRRERLAEELKHWRAFDLLRRMPSEENVRAAKRAYLTLAKLHHPDHGGTHEGFLRLKDAYDRAQAVWRRRSGAA